MDDLTPIAQQVVARVRDRDPVTTRRWLHARTTAEEREELLYILAEAVPDDRPWRQLVAWKGGEPSTRLERRRQQWRESKRRARLRPQPVDKGGGQGCGNPDGEAA